jgi:hypothetical protein
MRECIRQSLLVNGSLLVSKEEATIGLADDKVGKVA